MVKHQKPIRLWSAAVLLLAALALTLSGSGLPFSLEIFARTHGLSPADYPDELVALYKRNPDARDFVKYYPLRKNGLPEIDLSEEIAPGEAPLLMQWDPRWGYRSYNENLMGLSGCGPTCMAMAAIRLTGNRTLNPWEMAKFAEERGFNVIGDGTSWSFFTEGARLLGLDSVPITPEAQRIFDNLEVGNPIVAVMGPGDFTTTGHYILLAGTEDGKVRVNDPNSVKNSETLWDVETIIEQAQAMWVLR